MITFDELEEMLFEITAEVPQELYHRLNGGVILLPEEKLHPESAGRDDLFILGEYTNDSRGLGRYIKIYYGSFIRLYGYHTPESQRKQLKRILHHELTHHLESLAGERDLEIEDALGLIRYRRRIKKLN